MRERNSEGSATRDTMKPNVDSFVDLPRAAIMTLKLLWRAIICSKEMFVPKVRKRSPQQEDNNDHKGNGWSESVNHGVQYTDCECEMQLRSCN